MTQTCRSGLQSAEDSCKSTLNKAKSDCEGAIPNVPDIPSVPSVPSVPGVPGVGRKKRNIWYGGKQRIHIFDASSEYRHGPKVFDLVGFEPKNPNNATRKQTIFPDSDKNAYLEKVQAHLPVAVGPMGKIGLKPR